MYVVRELSTGSLPAVLLLNQECCKSRIPSAIEFGLDWLKFRMLAGYFSQLLG